MPIPARKWALSNKTTTPGCQEQPALNRRTGWTTTIKNGGGRGATLSDKTARKEYGLTEDEIIDAINAGSLDYRVGSVYGTPWFRLLRREVEHLVEVRRGRPYLDERRAKAELARVDADLTRLWADVAVLEERRSKLLAELTG